MAKSEQSAGMYPAGACGETPPTWVKRRWSKAIGKNIKNYSSNIKNLSPMSIHFSTFVTSKGNPLVSPSRAGPSVTEVAADYGRERWECGHKVPIH